jgi:hypothetical protein
MSLFDVTAHVIQINCGYKPFTKLRCWEASRMLAVKEITKTDESKHAPYDLLPECSCNEFTIHTWFGRFFVRRLHNDHSLLTTQSDSRSDVWVGRLALIFRVRDILSSNPGLEIIFSFRQCLHTNARIVPEIGTRPLPSSFLLVHYLLIILTLKLCSLSCRWCR